MVTLVLVSSGVLPFRPIYLHLCCEELANVTGEPLKVKYALQMQEVVKFDVASHIVNFLLLLVPPLLSFYQTYFITVFQFP
jgi:hypothetical protein